MNINKKQNKVFVSGKMIPYEEILAPISLFGYGAFTSIKYSPDGLLFLDKHLERLKYNCEELNINYPGDNHIINALKVALKENDCSNKEAIVRITLYPENISWENPHLIKDTECSIMVSTRDMYYLPENYKLKTVHLSRHMPHLKTINYTVNLLAKARAREADCHDALFVNLQKNITEGTAWNIFFIKDEKLYTPDLGSGLLKGITREAIIWICQKLNIDLIDTEIAETDLNQFVAAFVTNASQGPHSIMEINDCQYDINNDLLIKIKREYNQFPLTKLEL